MGQREPRLHGLRPSRRHPGRNWQLDMDYLHKLGPEELAFMERFCNESYHSAARTKDALHSQDAQRALWRAYKANERDALTRAAAVGRADGLEHENRRGLDSWQDRGANEREARIVSATHGAEYFSPGAVEDAMLEALDAREALQRKLSKASVCLKPSPRPRPPLQLLPPQAPLQPPHPDRPKAKPKQSRRHRGQ